MWYMCILALSVLCALAVVVTLLLIIIIVVVDSSQSIGCRLLFNLHLHHSLLSILVRFYIVSSVFNSLHVLEECYKKHDHQEAVACKGVYVSGVLEFRVIV